jgi:predicted nucleic acid-binding Zn ribbon protein
VLNVVKYMPTYVYETTDQSRPVRRFEVAQRFLDAPLKVDPSTGEVVRRVISGGLAPLVRGRSTGPCVGSVGSHSDL